MVLWQGISFPKLVPTWEFWFLGVLLPAFSNYSGFSDYIKVQMNLNGFKCDIKKIVTKLVCSWEFIPNSL